MTTRDILENHLGRFMAGDLAGVVSDYAPDAVFFTPGGVLKGPDEIRTMFRALLEEFAMPGASFDLKLMSVEGDHGYILWSAETANHVYELATDTFVVKSGRIVAQTYTPFLVPKG